MSDMSTGPISELVVPYDPGPLAEKVARRRRLVRSRLISLGITIAVLVLIYVWRREDLEGAVFAVLYALILGISLALLGAAVARQTRIRRHRKRHCHPDRSAWHPGRRVEHIVARGCRSRHRQGWPGAERTAAAHHH